MREWLRKIADDLLFEWKLRQLDDVWDMTGGYSWDFYSPSYYIRHAPGEPEKIRKISVKDFNKLYAEYLEARRLYWSSDDGTEADPEDKK